MTTYTSRFPGARQLAMSATVTLPDDAKVSGAFTMHYTDERHAACYTDGAHVNDHNQAIDYRGESWLARIDVYKLDDGTFTMTSPASDVDRGSVTRRENWSDAPRTYAEAIKAAMFDASAACWDVELAANAQEWTDSIRAEQLRRDIDELSGKLKAARKELRAIERRHNVTRTEGN